MFVVPTGNEMDMSYGPLRQLTDASNTEMPPRC